MTGLGGGFLAVGAGAALGAWARWGLGAWLNAHAARLPWGTLAANLLGGYLVGLAIAAFASRPDIPANWRLFLVTGLLGGLTTFSTFSAESVGLMLRGDWAGAFVHALAHLVGAIAFTALGVATWRAFL